MQAMLDRGVATRRGVMCAHLEPAYAELRPRIPLPESERARDGCILLPLFPQMTEAMQDQVVLALRGALAERAGRRPRSTTAPRQPAHKADATVEARAS